MKRLALYVTVIMATVAVLYLLWQFRSILLVFVLSLVLSATLRPLILRLTQAGLPEVVARIGVYVVIFGGLLLVVYLISTPLLSELSLLTNYLAVLYDSLYARLANGSGFQQLIYAQLPSPEALPTLLAGPSDFSALQTFVGVTQSTVSVVAGVVVLIVLSVYWSGDRNHFVRIWISVLPASARSEARSVWRKTEDTVGAYLRSESVQALIGLVLLGLGYYAMRLDYALLGALLAAALWLLPLIGSVLIAALAFLVGLGSTGDWTIGVAAMLYTVAVLALLEFVVEPRLFKRESLSGLLTILMMVVLLSNYGVLGLLVAPVLALAIQVLAGHAARAYLRSPLETSDEIGALEKRITSVQTTIVEETGEPVPPEIHSMVGRLEMLVHKARRESIMMGPNGRQR